MSEALTGLKIFQTIALRYVAVDMSKAIGIAAEVNIYAYDAYFIECSLRHSAPLMTLDRSLIRVAKALGVDVLE